MTESMLKPGDIVRSTGGRDKNRLMMIIDTDGKTLILADGKIRPVENPKRKNPKHAALVLKSDGDHKTPANKELRRLLSAAESEEG